jgi:G3E family GTPase
VIPLVLVTGFLGAGKTTLINQLLARRKARHAPGKLGVIVNELGAVGVDAALLGGETARQIELPGGCVCCVLGDTLDTTLLELVAQYPSLEAIVLETTGVAEPLPIAWAIARAPVAHKVRLAAVVTLVDATNFLASRPVSASVDAQVAYADVLLVTKAELAVDPTAPRAVDNAVAAPTSDGASPIDPTGRAVGVPGPRGRASLIDNSDVERAESVARNLAPRALLRRGTAAEHAAWLEALLADPELPTPIAHQVSQPSGQVSQHVHDDDCRHLDSPAAHGIDSVWLPVEHPVDVEELTDQLAELPPNYVRIKGIVRSEGGPEAPWVAVHRVGPRVSSEPIEPAGREQARIVALGPGVAVADLARCVALAAHT